MVGNPNEGQEGSHIVSVTGFASASWVRSFVVGSALVKPVTHDTTSRATQRRKEPNTL